MKTVICWSSNEEDFNVLIKLYFLQNPCQAEFLCKPWYMCVEGIFLVNMKIKSQLNSTLHDRNNKTNSKPDCASQKQLY